MSTATNTNPTTRPSPFLTPSATSSPSALALLALRRDSVLPVVLTNSAKAVSNTRFGSFPHRDLVDVPWGSQVLASTAKRNNGPKRGKKRKRNEAKGVNDGDEDRDESLEGVYFEAAGTGFAHLLSPTPELWNMALPHRTQVVYPPDYSYILQRMKARPGSRIIEAGSGSGSFTHAAARAVFSGYEEVPGRKKGQVYSFEYHEIRYETLKAELKDHGLEDIVTLSTRDVYDGGFLVGDDDMNVDTIFLDLPAPWLALPHLSRAPPDGKKSPLNPNEPVQICTFSPCIEQVQKTVSTMRELGWLEIDMMEMAQKRLDVRRERIGLQEEYSRNANSAPASVDEALGRLRELESKAISYHERRRQAQLASSKAGNGAGLSPAAKVAKIEDNVKKPDAKINQKAETAMKWHSTRHMWKEGEVVHRTEPELRTHTSYLVFAVLPRSWSAEDEAALVKSQAR